MKILWGLGLIIAIIGILINPEVNVININILKISSFWVEVIGAGILAIAGFPKGK